jgi:hypothetical protein
MYNFSEYFILEKVDFKKSIKTILFTDIVESSKKWSENEKKMFDILQEHEKSIKKITNNNNGMIVKTIGDAFMIVFDELSDAIKCGEEIQEDLVENPLKVGKNKIILRIGMCQGPVLEKKTEIQGKELVDYYGNTINSASRMESKVCKPGGIVFASLSKENKDLDKLVKKYQVEVVDYVEKGDSDIKRSGRLLTDTHRYVSKSIDELKGIKEITAYSCF